MRASRTISAAINAGDTRVAARSIAAWRFPHTRVDLIAAGTGVPSALAASTAARVCRSSPSCHSSNGGPSPSPSSTARMRQTRAASPASHASESWNTSKRATSATARSTASWLRFPGGNRSASFSISWRAASRLPSVASARKRSVSSSACCFCFARRIAIHCGSSSRSRG